MRNMTAKVLALIHTVNETDLTLITTLKILQPPHSHYYLVLQRALCKTFDSESSTLQRSLVTH